MQAGRLETYREHLDEALRGFAWQCADAACARLQGQAALQLLDMLRGCGLELLSQARPRAWPATLGIGSWFQGL